MSFLIFVAFVTALSWAITRGFALRTSTTSTSVSTSSNTPVALPPTPTTPFSCDLTHPKVANRAILTGYAAGSILTGYAAGSILTGQAAGCQPDFTGRAGGHNLLTPPGIPFSVNSIVHLLGSFPAASIPAAPVSTPLSPPVILVTADHGKNLLQLADLLARLERPGKPQAWKLIEPIGGGACATIYKAKYKSVKVAMKVSERSGDSKDHNEISFCREVRVAAAVCHDALLTARGYWHDNNETCIVLKLMSVDLRDFVEDNGRLHWREALVIIRRVLEGLVALHSAAFVHADIKPDNILLGTGFKPSSARLADLGSVVTLDELDQLEGGTIGYASPERYDRDGLGSKVDVWALGSVLGYLLSGDDLLPETPESILPMVDFEPQIWMNLARFEGVPVNVLELLLLLLSRRPRHRPTAAEAIRLVDDLLSEGINDLLTPAAAELVERRPPSPPLESVPESVSGVIGYDLTSGNGEALEPVEDVGEAEAEAEVEPEIEAEVEEEVGTGVDSVVVTVVDEFPQMADATVMEPGLAVITIPCFDFDFDDTTFVFPDLGIPDVDFGEFTTPNLHPPGLTTGWVILGSKDDPLPSVPRKIPGRAKGAMVRASLGFQSLKKKFLQRPPSDHTIQFHVTFTIPLSICHTINNIDP